MKLTIERFAENIFKKWASTLNKVTKSKDNLESTFTELFGEFAKNDVPFDIASDTLEMAIKLTLPSISLMNDIYRVRGIGHKGRSKEDFMNEWKTDVRQKAYKIFYEYYTTDGKINTREPEELIGGMTKADYEKSRKYALSHPLLPKINPMTAMADQDPKIIDEFIAKLEREVEEEEKKKNG